jgi:protein involved in polysaccharide export with SLBB domain
MFILLPLLILLLTTALNPLVQAQGPAEPTLLPQTRIVAGSVLAIRITDEPAISGDFTVSPQGTIHFVLTDDTGDKKTEWDVAVAGKTADQAQQAVIESLKLYFISPEVRLSITRMPKLKILMAGPVRRTELNLPLGSHLSDALNAAGCDPNTDYERILLLHKADGKTATMAINFTLTQSGKSEDDPALESGDRIILQRRPAPKQEATLKTVRIIGQVGREGDVPVGRNMTIKDVLDQVGGLNENADRKKVVLHRSSTGKDYELDADKIADNDPLFNIAVESGDYIVVGRRDVSQRYAVSGEVRAGAVYPFDPAEHMTVLRALEKAGGLTKKGDPRMGVLRRGFLNNPLASQDLPFDIDKIRKGKAQDWELIPGDVVVILPKQHRPTIWQNLLPLVFRFLPFGL